MKPIRYEDLYELRFLSDLNLSPDGSFASFSVHRADPGTDGYRSELWLLETGTSRIRLLASRGDVKRTVWLDEEHLLFTSGRERGGCRPGFVRNVGHGGVNSSFRDPASTEEQPDETLFFRISVHGGEAEPYLRVPFPDASVRPLGRERFLVFASRRANALLPGRTETPESDPGKDRTAGASASQTEEGKDFVIFDELPFWFNGKGVVNKLRSSLMLLNRLSGRLDPITPDYLEVSQFAVSPDRSRILYTGTGYGANAVPGSAADQAFTNTPVDLAPRETGLYLYDILSGETQLLVSRKGTVIESPAFFDNKRLFYEASTLEFVGRSPYYHIRSLADGSDRELAFPDASASDTVSTDAAFGGGISMRCFEGSLYFLQTIWSHTRLVRLSPDGVLSVINDEAGCIRNFDVSASGFYLIAMRNTRPAGLYFQPVTVPGKAGALLPDPTPGGAHPAKGAAVSIEEIRLDSFNENYCSDHFILTPEYFTYRSRNGYEMEGYVLKPAGYLPGRRYPGILEMHGGPKVAFGNLFHHEMQCLAHMGYFVFYTNPRGSDGRGEAFADITGRLGGPDYEDFMEFTDEVLRRYPDLNPERIGICGGSYGGFMCNWMVGHTDRFAAAASQRSISNYLTKGLCTDIGFTHNMAQLTATPWTDFGKVWEHSPLKAAPQAKTPTLFIQSDEDYRCWMSDAVQMYSALVQNGTAARMILFHGENHELSRSGKPKNRIARLREIGSWFETYLKGDSTRVGTNCYMSQPENQN